jgi:FtsH-binding integral membrane protein
MENKPSKINIAMKFGAIYGFSSIAVFLLFYLLGTDIQSKLPQLISYSLLVLFIVMGIKAYRDESLDGYISYGQSLGTGILISIFGGFITGIFTLIFFQYLAPDMVQRIMEETQKNMSERGGMSDEQMEMALSMTAKFMTPFWLFLFSVIGSGFMGFIFSLVISVFMKKEQNPFNSNLG